MDTKHLGMYRDYIEFILLPKTSSTCSLFYPVQFAIFCCSIGYTDGHIPVIAANDTIEVFLMKAPVFEFRFGDLLGKFVS